MTNCHLRRALKSFGGLTIMYFGKVQWRENPIFILWRGANMSIVGILSSNLFSAGSAQNTPSAQPNPSAFQQIKTEFEQLGQALQSGNLSQAQADFAKLSQNISAATQSSDTTTPATNASPAAQAFAQLGQDLQSGNLQGVQ
jgi:hypothetical protein